VLPPRYDRIVRARLERGFARHPNRTNPYAWRFFLGTDPTPTLPSPASGEGKACRAPRAGEGESRSISYAPMRPRTSRAARRPISSGSACRIFWTARNPPTASA
jgi:hypothetical protein